jgi:hypothetical protein
MEQRIKDNCAYKRKIKHESVLDKKGFPKYKIINMRGDLCS